MVPGGTSFVTTLPAPTMAFSPMVTLARMVEPEPMEAPFLTRVGSTFQSASVCSLPSRRGGAGVGVVDESHAVADEDIVLDGHAFADEGVAGDLAVPADGGVFLDLDEGADLGVVADRAAVEVDELRELDIFPELDVRGYAQMRVYVHR